MSGNTGHKPQDALRKLWERYCAGDNEAMGMLYEQLHARLTLFCLGWLKDRELAENIASESFVRLLNMANKAEIASVEAWLFTVSKNLCKNHLTQQQNRRGIWEQIRDRFASSHRPEATDTLSSEDWTRRMKEWFEPNDCHLWQLHEQGYSNEEIAARLQMTEKTVANRKSMIRKSLREKIRHYGI